MTESRREVAAPTLTTPDNDDDDNDDDDDEADDEESSSIMTEEEDGGDGTQCRCQCCFRVRRIALREKEFMTDTREYVWRECGATGKDYFALSLVRVAVILARHDHSQQGMAFLFGDVVYNTYLDECDLLLQWARDEHKHYPRGTSEFSLVRMERHFAKQPRILNLWLKLCVVYDVTNYMVDIEACTFRRCDHK